MASEAKRIDTTPEPRTHKVVLWMCELCIDGAGGECHVGGCAFCWNRSPDISLRHNVMVESIDGARLDYDTLKREPDMRGLRKGLRQLFAALPDAGFAVTADQLAERFTERSPLNISTALKKLRARGLVKREGLGTAHHPYRWSRS